MTPTFDLGREDGGVLVIVAVALPVLLLFASLAIDVGNWFEHSRHLQTQADAGALAAGGSFSYPTCDNNAISSMALQYANTENPQVGGTQANVTALVNSSSYANQGGSSFSDGQPCSDGYVDVKMTERNLPLFFGILSLFGGPSSVPAINAHARVSILQQDDTAGAMPIGVPDVNPTDAAAIVVNNSTGAAVTVAHLSQDGTVTANGNTLTRWDNASAALPVTIPAAGANYNTVVALGGKAIDLSSGNVGTICAESLVECFAENGTGWQGLSFIHGYQTTGVGTASAPIIRGATLSSGGCAPDPYFSDSPCSPTFSVNADFGGAANEPKGAVAVGAGCPNAGCTLTLNGTQWSGPITAPAGTGPFPIAFAFCMTKAACKANQADGTINTVQQMFVGSSDPTISGPVQLVQVGENGGVLANSLGAGTHNLVFYVGVQQNLANAQSVSDQPTQMRLTGNGGNSSRTQSLDCDPTYPNLKDELAQGCHPQYAVNTGNAPWTPCPNNVFGMAQPWQCVNIQTGAAVNQVPDGMGLRTGNTGGCVNPSHWARFNPGLPNDGFSPSDPRITQVFLVPFGSFSGSGGGSVPVEGFATFYITGWGGNGNGHSDPCPIGPAWPASPVDGKDDSAGAGYVVGHFIKYISAFNSGGGTQPCNPTSLNTCVAVMTQ